MIFMSIFCQSLSMVDEEIGEGSRNHASRWVVFKGQSIQSYAEQFHDAILLLQRSDLGQPDTYVPELNIARSKIVSEGQTSGWMRGDQSHGRGFEIWSKKAMQ
jgi:hypothetical protein